MDFMDIADRDFLGSREYNDDINNDSEFDSDFEHYVLLSASRRRLFGRKRSLHAILGSPPRLSSLPEGLVVDIVFSITNLLNQLLITFGLLASGHDLNAFLLVTVTLGSISIIDSFLSASTLFYIGTLILLTVPAAYERTEDIVDILIHKALLELNIRYAELMKKFFGYSQQLQEGCISPE
ncbi:hypothetical protein PIB30_050475 [Stylosanthes scabra]|uniref:Reticulon-like protein n=1 Tax=Stylosanthes scabra TaxID=79078 RepID=A0ABU6XHW4_9FABA|nr:hypothetical protein [Stylosanthes scabra]